ncbi:MAG: PhzF family phenazine biosynthesis protein [Candidatus Hermodarchaeota archaeon]
MKEIQSEGIPFYIVDVFTEFKYGGNQLAVVVSNNKLQEATMQKIANEMNYSETTFITSVENHDVRIFTPKVELTFAGHPTIGTAFILQQKFIKEKVKTISLNLKIGSIAILFKYRGDYLSEVWMEHKSPTFGGFFSPDILAQVLNLSESDFDGRFKIQEVSTGLPTLIVPLRSLDAVKRASINKDRYFELIMKTQAKTILIFSPETYDKNHNLNARFFADYYGVPEDPATGSANGCLAAYLARHEYFGRKQIDISVEQGYEMGRESLLFLRAEEKEGKFYITIGGKVVLVAEGMLV